MLHPISSTMWRVPLRRARSSFRLASFARTARELEAISPGGKSGNRSSAVSRQILQPDVGFVGPMKQASLGKFFASKGNKTHNEVSADGKSSKKPAASQSPAVKKAAKAKPAAEKSSQKEIALETNSLEEGKTPSKPLKRLRKASKEDSEPVTEAKPEAVPDSQPKAKATPRKRSPARASASKAADSGSDSPPQKKTASKASPKAEQPEPEHPKEGGASDKAMMEAGQKVEAAAQEAAKSPEAMETAAQEAFLDDSAVGTTEVGGTVKSAKKPSSPAKRKRPAVESASDSEVSAEENAAKSPAKKKAVLKYKAPTKKVSGVGTGALAAAELYSNFDLDKVAPWADNGPVPFAFLAATLEAIGQDSRRLAKTQQLVTLFRGIIARSPADLLPAVYLCTNQVAPAYTGIELGIGDSILLKALCTATGSQDKHVKAKYKETGDLGLVAASLRQSQRTMIKSAPLTVPGIHKAFREIAGMEGSGSQDKKCKKIQGLLVAATKNEPSFIMRALQGKLRIGLGAETVLVALAHAILLHKASSDESDSAVGSAELANRLEQASQAIKQAFSQCPDYAALIDALLKYPVEEVNEHVHFTAGIPVNPMLAKPTLGVSEVLDKFQDTEFTCEYKYDGERAQIHVEEGGRIQIFSRNAENNTAKYPDLVASIPGLLQDDVKSAVLDCEAVAYDLENDKILPFQVLSTRARKDVKVEDIKVKVCLYAFDVLYLNGETLLQRPLSERRQYLGKTVKEQSGQLKIATFKTSTDVEELQNFLDESVSAGTEGLIVKSMDSTYEPSKRSAHWLKLKKDYLKDVGDTFDLVPIGAWHGKGKRKGVYGAYLLAIYNEEREDYETISKIGTGFSEEQLADFHKELNQHVIAKPPSYYKYAEKPVPDVWFDPKFVWEVKAADLSISPLYPAAMGLVDANKGISIRFPRLVRVRTDKNPEQATGAEQVAEMYQKQAVLSQQQKKGGAIADDE